MATEKETAYPTLNEKIPKGDLERVYTPTSAEIEFVKEHTRTPGNLLCMLILTKCVQRLGYFVKLSEIPEVIPKHIATSIGWDQPVDMLNEYDNWRPRKHHIVNIRSFLNIMRFKDGGKEKAFDAMAKASRTKEDIVDIVNVGIEELIHHRYELPAFDSILRIAKDARSKTNASTYATVFQAISKPMLDQLEKLLEVDPETKRSTWNQLRQDPGKVTLKEIGKVIARIQWIRSLEFSSDPFDSIPYVKFRHFAMEAKSLNANRLGEITHPKKAVLLASMVKSSLARNIDDIGLLMVKKMGKIHFKGRARLDEYLAENKGNTDKIIKNYKAIYDHVNNETEEGSQKRITSIKKILNQSPELIEFATQHAVYGSKNYCRFLWPLFRNSRAAFFKALNQLEFVSTSSDQSLIQAIHFAKANQKCRTPRVSTTAIHPESGQTLILSDLSWIPDNWWFLVTGKKRHKDIPDMIDRHQFEVCLFSEIIRELKSADLCILDSDDYSDPSEQLVSMDELKQKLPKYGEIVGLPTQPSAFSAHIKTLLHIEANGLEESYPDLDDFNIDSDGSICLSKLKAKKKVPGLEELSELIKSRMPKRNIIDIIIDTLKTLDWAKPFGPISGFESKIKDQIMSYAATSFCYGCNLGPMQTERSLPAFSRKHLEWINSRHITEEKLEKAITIIINAYNKFLLPAHWGTGETASADGTRWNVHENNLFSEFHVRYGSYGGIGYYFVSDKYIALFSRFIPCGVYEAAFILDPFFPSKSDIKPHTVYGDTHAQSLTVFGLAYLLGIQLMPRIAHWKDLKMYKFDGHSYPNIGPLFTDEEIDLGLVEKHLNDMLRVAVSIFEGRVKPSYILRRLTNGTRKNKLFYAFQELGKVVRSAYLLKYLRQPELRRNVNHATTVSERFNDFVQFASFGNKGVIPSNSRDEQRKIIKYGHLVANILIFMNVYDQTNAMNQLIQEGHIITPEQAAGMSPYRKANINRFGAYFLDELRESINVDYGLDVVSAV